MTSSEPSSHDNSRLVAAAHAAASWARARKAEWEGPAEAAAPQRPAPPRPSVSPPPLSEQRSAARSSEPPVAIGRAAAAAPEPIAAPILRERTATEREPEFAAHQPVVTFGAIERERPRPTRWIARVAVAAAVVGAAVYGGRYLMTRPSTPSPVVAPASSGTATPAAAPVAGPARAGSLRVTSTPPGAEVLVDGKRRGVTPLAIDAVSVGRHAVEIQSGEGTIRRSVDVAAGQTTEVDEAIYAGWVAVSAPFDITVSEGGRGLRADDQGQIMLRPGSHELRVANPSLAFEELRKIDVKPGQVTAVSITPAKSSLTVTTADPAEVWIDGDRVGAAPVFALPVDLGTHELLVRRSGGGERRMSVTVTTRPLTVSVDFTKPGA